MKTQRMVKWILVLTLALAPAAAGTGWADDVVQTIGDGEINWSQGVIQGTGIGAPPEKYYGKPAARPLAIRAAKVVALRNILETVNGVRIDSNTVVKDFAVQSDVIRSQVEGIVKGARQTDVQYMSDGTVEVVMEISMYGEFSSTVLPQEIMSMPSSGEESGGGGAGSTVYTGLVVDARGLGVRPAMAPKILDEGGGEVYGSAVVSREYAVRQGMAGYAKEIDAAQSNSRVTDNPFVVKALRTEGPGNSDIVISNQDAAILKGAADTLAFLEKCRVMVVLD